MSITNTFLVGFRDVTKYAVVRVTNQFYHGVIGCLICEFGRRGGIGPVTDPPPPNSVVPILVLSSIPFVSTIQTRILFNNDFSERLATAKIFTSQRERRKQV